MRIKRLLIAASSWLAASLVAGGGAGAWAASADDLAAFDGRWSGNVYLDCNGVDAPIEVVIEDGEMSGKTYVRGMGQGDSTYHVSGYIDRRGRISDGRISGAFGFTMDGRLSGGVGKGRFSGSHCNGDWRFALEEAPQPSAPSPPSETEVVTASAPSEAAAPEIDATPPLIEAPATVRTERPVFELAGRVSDGSKIIEFTLNGAAAPLQADGSFYFTRGAALGDSELVITALDEWGNVAERRVRITRSAPAKAPEEPPAEESQSAALGRQADDGTAPRIQVPPRLVTDSGDIEITGSVWDESAITDLFVNERRFALNADGSFRTHQRLKIGINSFAFSATDEWGKGADLTEARLIRADLREGTLARYDEARNPAPVKIDEAGSNLGEVTARRADFSQSKLAKSFVVQTDFTDAILHNASFQSADLRHSVFERAMMQGADLSHSNLCGASFKQANLAGANLNGAETAETDFEDALLDPDALSKTQSRRAVNAPKGEAGLIERIPAILAQHAIWAASSGRKGERARLDGAELGGANLEGANMAAAILKNADLGAANLAKAQLAAADLSGIFAARADLHLASLRGANLSHANLAGADLTPLKNLRGTARVIEANLSAANLSGANLSGAKLAQCHLVRADLRGANLTDADLSGAELSGAKLDGTLLAK